jgi:hypothetical protein
MTKKPLFWRAQTTGNKRLSRTGKSLIPGLVTVWFFFEGLPAVGRCTSRFAKWMVPPQGLSGV